MSGGREREKIEATRELVELALDAGWTRAGIAHECRVDADTVSAWKKGKARGRRHELKPLLDAFGWRLRRGRMRVYIVAAPDAEPQWAQTERHAWFEAAAAASQRAQAIGAHLIETVGRLLGPETADLAEAIETESSAVRARMQAARAELDDENASAHRKQYLNDKLAADAAVAERLDALEAMGHADREVLEQVARLYRAAERRLAAHGFRLSAPDDAIEVLRRLERQAHAGVFAHRLEAVPGRIVFRHGFSKPSAFLGWEMRYRSVVSARWLVHHDGGRFFLVRQRIRELSPIRRRAWQASLSEAPVIGIQKQAGLISAEQAKIPGHVRSADRVHSDDDDACWLSEIEPPMDLDALLAYVDASIHRPGRPHGPNDEVTLPFLLRKALIEQGFDVPGVVFHGAD